MLMLHRNCILGWYILLLQPQMKAKEIAKAGIEALRSGKYRNVRLNFANPDMVSLMITKSWSADEEVSWLSSGMTSQCYCLSSCYTTLCNGKRENSSKILLRCWYCHNHMRGAQRLDWTDTEVMQVAHTGDLDATIEACTTCDKCVKVKHPLTPLLNVQAHWSQTEYLSLHSWHDA